MSGSRKGEGCVCGWWVNMWWVNVWWMVGGRERMSASREGVSVREGVWHGEATTAKVRQSANVNN